MTKSDEYPLAGVYITDGAIFAAVGRLNRRTKNRSFAALDLSILGEREGEPKRFAIAGYDAEIDPKTRQFVDRDSANSETARALAALEDVIHWIHDVTPDLRKIYLGCYGPFKNIRWPMGSTDSAPEDYGYLGRTSHGELSEVDLYQRVASLLELFSTAPKLRIETDVAVMAAGYIYTHKSDFPEASQRDTTLAFISAGRGIGGTFIRAHEALDWKGDLHPEFGQIHVDPWPREREHVRILRPNARRHYATTVEAVASIPALEGINHHRSFEQIIAQYGEDSDYWIWDRQAWYLAQIAWTITCVACPSRIIFFGELLSVPSLCEKLTERFFDLVGHQPVPKYPGLDRDSGYLDTTFDCRFTPYDPIRSPEIGAIGALCLAADDDRLVSIAHTKKDNKQTQG